MLPYSIFLRAKISALLREHLPRLEFIASLKQSKLRTAVLKEFSKDPTFCRALREVAKNTLKRNVSIRGDQVKELYKHRKVIKGLAKRKNKRSVKRKLVEQSGGFLPILIPIIATAIGEIIRATQ